MYWNMNPQRFIHGRPIRNMLKLDCRGFNDVRPKLAQLLRVAAVAAQAPAQPQLPQLPLEPARCEVPNMHARPALELLGAIAWANGAADSALMHLRDALRLGVEDGEIIPTTALNVAVLQRELGRPDSALHYARLAYPILRRTGDRQELARYYNEVGLALVDLSFHDPSWRDSALAAYRQARPRVGAADRAAWCSAVASLGLNR